MKQSISVSRSGDISLDNILFDLIPRDGIIEV